MKQMTVMMVICLMSLFQSGVGLAATRGEAEETARLIGMLFSAARVVIERNQPLINDPTKGDKGFTPVIFERELLDEFRARTNIDLDHADQVPLPTHAAALLQELVHAGKMVVADAQSTINKRGIGYKNFIPASFGSGAASRFSKHSQVQLKQTTLQPRNPENAPDAYEEAVLRQLMILPSQSVTIHEVGEKDQLRVLTPIYYRKDCLSCHGQPAGELDISGYKKEGADEGDLAGAISVTIPLSR